MGNVVTNAIMSLDGYVARQDNTIGRLFDLLQNGDVAIPTPAETSPFTDRLLAHESSHRGNVAETAR